MKTQLTDGINPAARDEEIHAFVRDFKVSPWGSGDTRFRVAVKNSDGAIYRRIDVEETQDMVSLMTFMNQLGFVDEVPTDVRSIGGFDAIFRIA